MVALRTRPRGGIAPFGLFTLAFALLPAPIGIQDLSALFSYRAEAAQRPAGRASPFGTIHLATYSFPRPVGTAIPRLAGYRLASLDTTALELADAVPRYADAADFLGAAPLDFPKINRRRKGDSLLPALPPPVGDAPPSPPARSHQAHAALDAAPGSERATPSPLLDELNADAPPEDSVWPELATAEASASDNPTMDTARLYFGIEPMEAPAEALDRPASEPDAAVPLPASRPAAASGETVAGKGEVTGKGRRPMSPAERLGLTAKARSKAEKCLANAVYFEARGESVRGQIAVAQVVMNRVFSEFYPGTVCGVVYQNAHRRLACQFTFACDGIRDVVTEQDAWQRAKQIAKDTLEGKLWLDNVGKATHYHANWVRPWWVRSMRKLHRIGVHTFYRPRRWGDGADEPVWGDEKLTAEVVKTL